MLTEDQLIRMHAQASNVVNGFARVREQQARDVMTLVACVGEMKHAQELLTTRLVEARAKLEKASAHSPGFAGVFDDLFKGL